MLLVSAPASGLSPAASVECRAHGSHDRCRPNGSEPVLRNAYEQGFRRRRVVCPPEAHHGRVQDLCERRATPARGSLKRSIGFVFRNSLKFTDAVAEDQGPCSLRAAFSECAYRARTGWSPQAAVCSSSLLGKKRRLAGSFRFSQLAAGRPGGLLIPRFAGSNPARPMENPCKKADSSQRNATSPAAGSTAHC